MQQTGCLKKRRKRNLAKVAGLSTLPYDETTDTYRGLDIYRTEDFSSSPKKSASTHSNSDSFNVTVSRLHDARKAGRLSSSTRITRDPTFHTENGGPVDDFVDVEYGSRPGSPTAYENNVEKSEDVLKRPYLLDKTVVTRLRQLLLLGKCSGTFPWSWNRKEHKIDKWSPIMEKLWKIFWFFVTIQTVFLTGFQFYSFYTRVKGETKTYREIFMNSLSVYWYVCAVYFNINLYLYKDQIRQYINTMFAMNKSLCDKYLVSIDGYQDGGRILINLSIPSNCSQVFASVALFCVMPYQPWYMYAYIYKSSNPWFWLIPGALQEFVVVGQVITNYMLTAWIVVAHTNSVDFWLKEMHNNNDTGYTISKLREPKRAVETYRSLQILCTCFNDCMSPLAIPLVKIHIMTGLIPCGYVLIRSMNHLFIDEFPGILTYPIGVVDCATAGFAMLSMAAEMFDLGIGFVDSWSRTKQKDFRRILTSLPALKVKIGSMYYITVSTTITFFKCTLDYVIDCIMTFP